MDPASAGGGTTSPGTLLVAFAALVAGVLGLAAVWTVLNLHTGALNGWAALLAAADAALLLRLAGLRRGRLRAAMATVATLATAMLVGFLTAAARMGLAFGLQPLESAGRMSTGLAWTLVESAAAPWDVLALAVSLPLAWWLCR